MKSFFAALGFLTLFPVPRRWCDPEEHLRSAVLFFPLVGFLIGGLAAAFAAAAFYILPAFPAAVCIVIALIAVSGGMHMDGLADSADGFLSARKRDRMLEIMRDSRIGVMGVIAVISVFCLKISLLSSIPQARAVMIVFLMPLAGRTALVVQMALNSYARAEQGGIATVFSAKGIRGAALYGALLLLASGWIILKWQGLLAGVAALLLTIIFSAYSRRMIGGYTGDTLGAGCELAEIIPALIPAIYAVFPDSMA